MLFNKFKCYLLERKNYFTDKCNNSQEECATTWLLCCSLNFPHRTPSQVHQARVWLDTRGKGDNHYTVQNLKFIKPFEFILKLIEIINILYKNLWSIHPIWLDTWNNGDNQYTVYHLKSVKPELFDTRGKGGNQNILCHIRSSITRKFELILEVREIIIYVIAGTSDFDLILRWDKQYNVWHCMPYQIHQARGWVDPGSKRSNQYCAYADSDSSSQS